MLKVSVKKYTVCTSFCTHACKSFSTSADSVQVIQDRVSVVICRIIAPLLSKNEDYLVFSCRLRRMSHAKCCWVYSCNTIHARTSNMLLFLHSTWKWLTMEAFCLLIPQKSNHLQSICSVCCDRTSSRVFWGGYDTRCSCFLSILFTDSHIYELLCLCLPWRQTVPGWDLCRWGGRAGLIGAEPQAHWTLRAVWILPAGCSSHCVIGRIMFRDSLSLAPPYVPLEQLGAF